jgi:hypothetical protein
MRFGFDLASEQRRTAWAKHDRPSLDLCPFSAVMHDFCNATWCVNLNLACGSVGWGCGCCIQALEAVWRSKETRGGISFTPFRTPNAGLNCTSGRKGSGRIFRRSKRPFAMRASSERFRTPLFSTLHLSYPRSGTRPLVIGLRRDLSGRPVKSHARLAT